MKIISYERLKDNVTPILNPVDKVKSIGGYEFDWNDKSNKKGHDVGVIAQEIEKVLGKPVNLIGKAGGTLDDRGEYVYYDKPTKEEIRLLKTYIPKTFGFFTSFNSPY